MGMLFEKEEKHNGPYRYSLLSPVGRDLVPCDLPAPL